MRSVCSTYENPGAIRFREFLCRDKDQFDGSAVASWPFRHHFVLVYDLDHTGRPVLWKEWFESGSRLDWFPQEQDRRIGGPWVLLGLN